MEMSGPSPFSFLLLLLSIFITNALFSSHLATAAGTIAFTTDGRSRYNFDIFAVSLISGSNQQELQLTDGISVNYNGFFPSNTSNSLIYASERNSISNIYVTSHNSPIPFTFPLLQTSKIPNFPISFKDRPSLSGDNLIYVSTHQSSNSPRQSWAAVYSTLLPTGTTKRLTPADIADFSPSVSPSGDWTAVASSGELGWSGEVRELNTSIFVFKTADGSERSKLIEHGGWPCWGSDDTLYFHRVSEDGWWSVYRARISWVIAPAVVSIERVTPAGFHAFTPAASVGSPGIIAVATRRGDSKFRHIEVVDFRGGSNAYIEVTRSISPRSHHYNPFISPDGRRIGYHRCRGGRNGSPPLLLENIRSPVPETSLFRIDGSFPSFSHDGKLIAYVGLPGLYVVNSDGSGKPRKVLDGNAFPTAWDWKREGVIYTSLGPDFASERTKVDIVSITLGKDGDENAEPLIKKLTSGGENNAFPSPSPDGKWVVFRSGRSGHKNLYVMDAVEGESGGIYQLTEGPWSDTMCNWSPDGEWIAFASDRGNPGSGGFAIYMVHPNGTGLRKVVHSGDGGRTNHPWFSPDSKSVVFTSDYGGVSAEPISNPHHYQPYGEIYIVKIDGSDIQRLTQNSYEDGTPTWTPFSLKPVDVAETLHGSEQCRFDDCHWLTKAESDGVLAGTGC